MQPKVDRSEFSVRGAWRTTRMWAALGAATLATVTSGLGVATPAAAGLLRADVGIGLSVDGGLRLSVGASVGFGNNEWNGDNSGEQNPMSTVTGTTGAQAVWNRTDASGRKFTGKGVGLA